MSDIAHLLPRCPSCGYGLRMVRGYWWCDACKTTYQPQKSPSLGDIFRKAAENLRRFFTPAKPRHAVLTYPTTSYPPPERRAMLSRCPSCGALTPRESSSCVHCGTRFGQPAPPPRPVSVPAAHPPQYDELVYRYIVANEGQISLSRASGDLHMTVPELQASINRLESSRKIMRDSSRNGPQGTG